MSSSDLDWVDELLDGTTDVPSQERADHLLDYCLHLISNSTLGIAREPLEFALIDQVYTLTNDEWDQNIVMLRLNQLRVVDLYSCSQRVLSKWVRLIAFHEL